MECTTLRWAMMQLCIMVSGMMCLTALNTNAADNWSPVARFEKMAEGDINNKDGWKGSKASNQNTTPSVVKQADGNKALKFDGANEVARKSGIKVPAGKTMTFFFRIMFEQDPDKGPVLVLSLSENDKAGWSDLPTRVSIGKSWVKGATSPVTVNHDGKGVTILSEFPKLNKRIYGNEYPIVGNGAWHLFWVVVDNAKKTLQVYIQAPDRKQTQLVNIKDKSIKTFSFAGKAKGDLTWLVMRTGANEDLRDAFVDDFHLAPGSALSIPNGVPLPKAPPKAPPKLRFVKPQPQPEKPFGDIKTLPSGEQLSWGKEPVEELSPVRGQIVLNGPWQFMPAAGANAAWTNGAWGWIRVPGTWTPGWTGPGILIDCPKTPFWSNYYGVGQDETGKPKVVPKGAARNLETMWYRRQIEIPANWSGRAVLVDVKWLSTDAEVFIDGKKTGSIAWPTGKVDITKYVKAGGTHTLRMRVAAVAEEGFTWTSMGTEEGMATRKKKHLASRGLVGDVLLVSRPKGAIVTDAFVRTSTREKNVALDVEVTGVKQGGSVAITAAMVGPDGKVEKTFTAKKTLKAADVQRFVVLWPWADPKLWDVENPNLYTLQLKVDGAGVKDIYAQRFGFREFWIEGRDIFLNGKPFRLRPFGLGGGPMATARTYRSAFEDMKALGTNVTELWPNEISRGGEYHDDLIYRLADEVGYTVMGRASNMRGLLGEDTWDNAEERAKWLRPVEIAIRRSRNCPSVFAWVHSGNTFGYANDISPQMMGQKGTVHDDGILKKYKKGEEACNLIRNIDSTRPVMTHHGGYVGEIHTANHYLNMIPLQEREEWMSEHVKTGDMPYCGIEFGAPDELTFHRNRRSHGESSVSEPWHTEFAAVYFGPEAYKLESTWQRGDLLAGFKEIKKEKKNEYFRWWDWRYARRKDEYPTLQKVLELFITNTRRSWRASGHTGGMLTWSKAHGWANEDLGGNPADTRPWHAKKLKDRVVYDTFEPGTRGPWQPYAPKHAFHPYSPKHQTELPAGTAVRKNTQPTLAYIAGAPDFYDKDHLFATGQTVKKQIVIINDTRNDQPYTATITVTVAGKQVESASKSGTVQVGKNVFEAFSFKTPASIAGAAADGEIRLTTTIGDAIHEDSFSIRVHKVPAASGSVTVFDPVGMTSKMFKSLGYTVKTWSGGKADVVVIGREVLSRNHDLPTALASYVSKGGRVIVMEQDPEWLRGCGWRISRHVTRRAWPLGTHPITKGLVGDDFRDWSGAGTLVKKRDNVEDGESPVPPFGWHWGNRGSVSSGAFEKPHHAGWTPVIECEFDLQYSPLMELNFGQGKIVWSQLDLSDNVEAGDPVAKLVAQRIVDYTKTAPTPQRRKTVYIGSAQYGQLLKEMGLNVTNAKSLDPNSAGLAILGPDANVPDAAISAFGAAGGNVLILAQDAGTAPLGATIVQTPAVPNFVPGKYDRHSIYNLAPPEKLKTLFHGAINVPAWPELAGVSSSEVRYRTFYQAKILKNGIEIGANGLFGRQKIGKGVAVYCQFDPLSFDVRKQPYFRFTRWRQRRAIAQIIANLGGGFSNDAATLNPQPAKLPLAGDMWKVKLTQKLKPVEGWSNRRKDHPMTDEAKALVGVNVDASGWKKTSVPQNWDAHGEEFRGIDGECVYRRELKLPDSWVGKDLVLEFGQFEIPKKTLDDQDDTFFNGKRVGGAGNYWNSRSYPVPGNLVQQKNVLAIRLFDKIGDAGIFTMPQDFYVRLKNSETPELYHPDYREDWREGDEPYRWVRW